jgi:hypothetical protein
MKDLSNQQTFLTLIDVNFPCLEIEGGGLKLAFENALGKMRKKKKKECRFLIISSL